VQVIGWPYLFPASAVTPESAAVNGNFAPQVQHEKTGCVNMCSIWPYCKSEWMMMVKKRFLTMAGIHTVTTWSEPQVCGSSTYE
jgi:hypothetical protein